VFLNGTLVYTCALRYSSDSAVHFDWFADGSSLHNTSSEQFATRNYEDLSELTIQPVTNNLNMTTIRCRAVFGDGKLRDSVLSQIVIQGKKKNLFFVLQTSQKYKLLFCLRRLFSYTVYRAVIVLHSYGRANG